LSPEEFNQLDPVLKDQFRVAKNMLYGAEENKGKDRVWTNGTDFITLPLGQAPPPGAGYKPYEKPSAAMADPGSKATYYAKWAKEHNKTVEEMTDADIDAADTERKAAQSVGSKTTSTSSTDVHGNRTTDTTRTPITAPPTAPKPATKTAGAITPPPSAPKSASAPSGDGKITAPPKSGKTTLTDENRTNSHSNLKDKKFSDATTEYNKHVDAIKKQYASSGVSDPNSLNLAMKGAQQRYDAAKAQIVLWDADFLQRNGVNPWKQKAADAQGNVYGTMDGSNWVNVNTGMSYQEQ
jgi:hypothetical protein